MASPPKYSYMDEAGNSLGLLTAKEAVDLLNLPPRPEVFQTYNDSSCYPPEGTTFHSSILPSYTSGTASSVEGVYYGPSSGYTFTSSATVEPRKWTEPSYNKDYEGKEITDAGATMSDSGNNKTTRRCVKRVAAAKYDSPSRHVWRLFPGGHDDTELYHLVTEALTSAERTEAFMRGSDPIYYCRCSQRDCSLILLRRKPIKSDVVTRRCARCTRDGKNDLIPSSTTSTAAPPEMDTMWPEWAFAQGSSMPTLVSTEDSGMAFAQARL